MSIAARAAVWSLLVAALCAWFGLRLAPALRFETDLVALLPADAQDAAEERALARFADRLGREAVWLVGDADFAKAKAAAIRYADTLRASPAFASVNVEIDASWPEAAQAAYLPYRDGLLSARARAQLQSGDIAAVLGHAQQALYSPAAFLRRLGPAADPLALFGDFLDQAAPGVGRTSLRDGVLVVAPEAGSAAPMNWVLVVALLADSPFSTDEQRAASTVLDAARTQAEADGVQLAGTGMIRHSLAATGLARGEILLFGGIQFALLAVILWWVFRSLRLLLLSAATLAVALVAALAFSGLVFDRLHVMTLVFCSNLAGIAIDYSIYYAADQFRAPGNWRPRDALAAIGPAITMSGLAAVLSYALLAVAPFPGLRQIALFCCVGLAAAYLCVMAWFPAGLRAAPPELAQRLAARIALLERLRRRCARLPLSRLAAGLATVCGFGLAHLHFSDDVRQLQPHTPALYEQEEQVRALIGTVAESRFFLVRGADEQQLLEREEALTAKLDALVAEGRLASYRAVSRALPSAARQRDNRALLAQRVYNADGLAPQMLRTLGFDDAAVSARLAAFGKSDATLTPKDWLDSAAAQPYRHLWLGDIGGKAGSGEQASIVTIVGLHLEDRARLAQLAGDVPGARFVDRIAEVSDVLKRYRERALALVVLAAFASALLLAVPYGLRAGFKLMIAPVAACLATLGVFGFLGVEVTFFHVVALHLVTGLSMEYAILLLRPQWRGPATLLAATLAAMLALLAFGLLAFSKTPFIHSLGSTVALGVSFGFAFAWLAGTLRPSPVAPTLAR